jgi:hypothetical protein
MSFLRSQNQPATYPQYTGLQIQTSSGAVPISIVYGTNKIAPNVIWSGSFQTIPVSSGKGGGKGGLFNTSSGPSGYDYRTAIMMGLCEGPITSVGAVWNGQTVSSLASGEDYTNPLTLFNGATPQTTWGYLTGVFPSQALAYNGLAYICASDYDLGSSAALDSLSIEIYGTYNNSGANGADADPALIIQDFLTNAQYGVGFPAASIDAATLLGSNGDGSYQTYCKAAGLAISPALIDQEAANSILTRWLQLTNTAAVWSSGVLKFIPYGDSQITGTTHTGVTVTFGVTPNTNISFATQNPSSSTGSATFVPNLTPIYNLTDDDFIHDDDKDPVQIQRTDPYAAYNMQILEIFQRTNYYDATPITVFDQNAIELYGLRIASTVTAHEICDPNVAQTSAQLILQRGLYIRNHYTFKLSWEYCLLEPMDLVTLTDANLGLNNAVVRITEVEEDDNGLLSITAEEFPAGTATAVLYPVQTGSSAPVDRGTVPSSVNPPIILEPPASLAGSTPQIWVAVSGGSGGVANPNWGGANVWASLDGNSYTAIGQVTAPARQGVLSAPLPARAASNPDSVDTLSVNLAESNGTLASTSPAGAQNAVTLAVVDDEFLAYEIATLTGTNTYDLTTLYRGLYGTAAASHAIGAPFARLDSAIFEFDLPINYVGRTIYLKFQSFNVFGGGVEDLSSCTAYTYSPSGAATSDPIATQLLSGISTGLPVDFGQVNITASVLDDFGTANAGAIADTIDLGNA